jgi:hypothetical protein
MSLTIIIPMVFAGLLAASEYFMARHSKWDVLAQKFRNASTPPNEWRGCRFVQMEIRFRPENFRHAARDRNRRPRVGIPRAEVSRAHAQGRDWSA